MPRRKGPGRPARTDRSSVATERIEIRVTKLERTEWQYMAERAGLTLSEWIRQRCTDVARGMIGVP